MVASILGYFIYSSILSRTYALTGYADNIALVIVDMGRNYHFLHSVLLTFGYSYDVQALSLRGLASIMSIISLFTVVYLTFTSFRIKSEHKGYAITLFFSSIFLVNAIILNFTSLPIAERYLVPVLVWLIPMLAVLFDYKDDCENDDAVKVDNKAGSKSPTKTLIVFVLAVTMLNSAANTLYITTPTLRPSAQVVEMRGAANFLVENEYKYGFASFWNANVLTEITNGSVQTVALNDNFSSFMRILSPSYYYDEDFHSGKTFILFSVAEDENIQSYEHQIFSSGTLVYSDENYVVMHFDDVRHIQAYIN